MDNSNAYSASTINDGVAQQLQVIKIYTLDGKPVAESQFWVAVTQLAHENVKRIFLRDGHHHRLISTQSALNLLSSDNKKDLYGILKVTTNKGGSAPVINSNKIERIHIHPLLNQVNVMDDHMANHQLLGLNDTHVNAQGSLSDYENSVFSTTSTNLIAIAELVQRAQLQGWGSIKVTGSDFFRKQVWLQAAAKGLYIEGYIHTEDDRQALFKQIPPHAHGHIRPEYKPNKDFLKKTHGIKAFSSNINKQKIATDYDKNKVNFLDLSDQEITYLLMRVHQMELNKKNLADAAVNFVQSDNLARASEVIEYAQTKSEVQVGTMPAQSPNADADADADKNDIIQLSVDSLSNELDV